MGTTWTLSSIRSKVRKLTGRPSTNQLSNEDLDDYINHFYMEDIVAILDLEELSSLFKFHTTENAESYSNIPVNYSLLDKAYVNGDILHVYKDYDLFYSEYGREIVTRENVGTGDGSTNPITGTLNSSPVSPENITFDDDDEVFTVKGYEQNPKKFLITNITQADPAVVTTEVAHGLVTGDKVQIRDISVPDGYDPDDDDDVGMSEMNNVISTIVKLTDTTFELANIDSSSFSEYISGGFVQPLSIARLVGSKGGTGSVTLSDGSFSLSFNTTVTSGQDVRANYEVYSTGKPDGVLFYGDELYLRPVPDGVYQIKMLTKARNQPLSDTNDSLPENSWGKYIAYGAAIDILLDAGQIEAANMLENQFERMRSQIEAKRIKNFDDQRAIPRF